MLRVEGTPVSEENDKHTVLDSINKNIKAPHKQPELYKKVTQVQEPLTDVL